MTRPIRPSEGRKQAAQWPTLTTSRPDALRHACSFHKFRALSRWWGRLGRSPCAPPAWPLAGVLEFLEVFAPLHMDPLEEASTARSVHDATVPF